MKETGLWKYIVMAALVSFGFVLNPTHVPLSQAQWDPGPMPKEMRIASYDVGGGVYIITAALGEGIQKKFGVRLRSLPVGTGTSRILNVKIGNTDFGATIRRPLCCGRIV